MMSPRPKKRSINGILLLNKAQGISSNKALQQAKSLYTARKAGHTGSLDPLATGMLPLCFGEATKFSQFLLDADKRYQAVACLGIKTDTADALGQIIAQVTRFSVSQERLLACLADFRGSIQQVPSMYSALKHQGRPLYRYAREGVVIERAARTIHIHQLDLLAFDGVHFSLDVTCSKGTYIRNLVEDIGEALGVGAHLTALHRQYTAGFAQEPMLNLAELAQLSESERDALLLPMDRAIDWMPECELSSEQSLLLRQGREISLPSLREQVLYRLYDSEAQFIGIGQALSRDALKAHRLIATVEQPA
ncbi:MAG: tRNA pseudouridine(55) synthase TruB [Legionellaceae bacterium]|nr:tRNA pseudouridine(55) synthase TruB [Legionellaceae bacterium]